MKIYTFMECNNLEISEREQKIYSFELDSLNKEFWYWNSFRACYLLPMFNRWRTFN